MNNTVQNKVSLEEILYYIMFSILLSTKGIGLDEGSILFRVCLIVASLLFVAKIFVGRYSTREFIFIAVGLIWGIYSFINIGSFGIFVYVLMLFGMKNISVSKVMRVGAWVWGCCMFFTITAAIFFDRTGVRLVHEKLGLGPLLRESLGYTHPNVLHISYILLMVFVLYFCEKENIWRTIFVLMLGNAFVFIYSMSYTGVLISAVLIVVFLYFEYRNNISKIENIIIQSILPLCIGVSVVCPMILTDKMLLYFILNKILNNRIWAIQVFFVNYDITLLGEKILASNYSIDNSFVYSLAWHGVLFFVGMTVAYWFLIRCYLKENRKKELVIIISFLIAGLTEQFLFNASIKNITVIFLGDIFFKYMKRNKREYSLFGNGNVEVGLPLKWLGIGKEYLKDVLWKKIFFAFVLFSVITFGIISFIPMKSENAVYVYERLCDCNGESVEYGEIENASNSLIIGNSTEKNAEYYFFSHENSNLIAVANLQYRISLSIYISLGFVIMFILIDQFIRIMHKK